MSVKPTYEELEQKVKVLEEQLTKSIKAEESLHDTKKHYRFLFDHAPDGILIIDPATARFLDFNETAHAQLGYSREEFSKLSIYDLEIDETPEEIRSHIEYIVKNGISDFETRQRTKQGKIRDIHITAQYTEFLEKPVYHCIWRDITERKQAEQELRWKTALLEAQLEATIDGILIINSNGQKILANKRLLDICKIPENIRGKNNPSLLQHVTGLTKYPEKFLNKVKHLYDHPEEISRDEIEFNDGTVLDRYSSPVLGANGEYYGRIWICRDITNRKRMEAALKESERRLTDIIDFLPDPTYAIDLSGKVIAWNRAIEEMTGVKAKDMLGKGDHEYMMPFYGKRRPALINLALEFDKELEKKYDFVKGEGDVLLAEADVPIRGIPHTLWGKARPLYDGDNNIVGAIESVRDITERRQMELALRESEKRLADIIDFLPDATMAIDLSGKVIAWNRAMEKISGVKAADIIGKDDYEYTIPFYGMRRPALIDLALRFSDEDRKRYAFVKKEGDILTTETRVTIGDTTLFLLGKARPLYDGNGKITGAIESIRDITLIKEAEKALQKAHDDLEIRVQERTAELIAVNKALQKEIYEREYAEAVLKEREEKYNQFFKTSRDCVFITLFDGKFIDMNNSLVEVLGYSSREELMQINVKDLYEDRQDRIRIAGFIVANGYVQEHPAYFHRKDGRRICVVITAVPVYGNDGDVIGFQGTLRDVTEQRKNEEELRKYRKKLETMVAERTNELEERTRNIQETNTTLNVLLKKREEDKKILEENLATNIGELVIPYVEKIKKSNLDAQQLFCLDIIKKHIEEIASPILKNVQHFDFTSREIQVAALIRDGKTTKEIAQILGIGKGSVDTHRNSIRKKLNLGRASNLQTSLRFLKK